MFKTLKGRMNDAIERYLENERGQDAITWILIIIVLWLLISAMRLTVQ